jgi:hypothetical protein
MRTTLPLRPFLLALCLLAPLAACDTPPSRPTFPDIRFTDQPPLRIDVAALDIRTEYQAPFRPPNVEHLFPVPPARAAENWARDRLQPVGRSGRARYAIRTASAIETELPKSSGLKGAVTTEAAQRYDLTLEGSLEVLDEHGLPVRTVRAKATRSQTVLEGITPNQREETWYAMTKGVMADFNQQMENEIRSNFGTYLQ